MAVGYLQPDGVKRMTHDEWATMRKLPEACILREYDNGIIYVKVEWIGKIVDYGNVFPDYYKNVRLDVFNYGADGTRSPDPVMSEQWFQNEKKAFAAYETFVTNWSDSHLDSEGAFIEEGNALTPPPPPNPDAPTTTFNDPVVGDSAW